MSPEDLSAYLLGKGLDPDAVQDVLVKYLTWTGEPIRHPKAWAWLNVFWRTQDAYRTHTMRGHRLERQESPLSRVATFDNIPSPEPDPLTQAERRQRIERFAQTMKTSCKPSHKWSLWNQRGV